jgi:hypothetical protein
MYDVYLNPKGRRLIVPKGKGLPSGASGKWTKARTVKNITDDAKDAIATVGYHLYKLTITFDEHVKKRK